MIENKITIKSFLADVCIIFTVMILAFTVEGILGGEQMETLSTLYQAGGKAIAYSTILQVLLCAALVITLKAVIFSDILFKRMMLLWRVVFMVLATLGVTSICIVLFGWFPIGDLVGWGMFLLSFLVCFGISTTIMIYETKKESTKYEKLLEEYKQNRKDDAEKQKK